MKYLKALIVPELLFTRGDQRHRYYLCNIALHEWYCTGVIVPDGDGYPHTVHGTTYAEVSPNIYDYNYASFVHFLTISLSQNIFIAYVTTIHSVCEEGEQIHMQQMLMHTLLLLTPEYSWKTMSVPKMLIQLATMVLAMQAKWFSPIATCYMRYRYLK